MTLFGSSAKGENMSVKYKKGSYYYLFLHASFSVREVIGGVLVRINRVM